MDPAAPNYDRPPDRRKNRRRNLTRINEQLGARTGGPLMRGGSDAIVPTTKPNIKNLPTGGNVAQRLGLGGSGAPGKGNLGTVDRFKAAGLTPPKNAKEIGFFNATHEHGEPMKNLIAKLKRRRGQGKPSASYTPSNSISSSR